MKELLRNTSGLSVLIFNMSYMINFYWITVLKKFMFMFTQFFVKPHRINFSSFFQLLTFIGELLVVM